MRWVNRVQALVLVLFIQSFFMAIAFFGTILDPLIGLWVAAIYFFVIGSFLTYHLVLSKFGSRPGVAEISD